MSEQALYKNLMRLGGGIEACLDGKHTGPALILLYSAIDTTGWLDAVDQLATGASFQAWVDRYLLKAMPLACTASDLWAARCGLLHTFTPDSKHTLAGKARRICYAWGNARVEDIQSTIDLTGTGSQYVAVHVNDLYEAWRRGLLLFVQDLDRDHARGERVYTKAGKFFADLGISDVKEVLRVASPPASRMGSDPGGGAAPG